MTPSKLKEKLDEAMDDFVREIEFMYATFEGQAATKDDLKELAKQTYYLFGRFRDEIVNYLKNV